MSELLRVVVLYETSQGHFMAYYDDFTDCPLYTAEKTERNVIDLAKTTFVRPGSNKVAQPDTPPHAFDILTTEREWTLCAESQESEMKWLKIITRAIDEDVAILPDEDLFFKVKPKVDPLGNLCATDYSTTLKVSANGIAVWGTDANTGLDKQYYFWIYTDFYKWSLLSQQGKLALLVNVFADSSFSKRNEFIFRTKEALRLSTAIEFFIEKFMSVMHVRMEGKEGVDMPAAVGDGAQGMIQANHEEFDQHEDAAQELDLLNMDDGFGQSPASNTTPKPVANNADPFGSSDPFGAPVEEKPKPASKAQTVDLFGDDPFGAPAPAPAPAPAQPKVAPPLTDVQLQQHKAWLFSSMTQNGGPIYDDGTIQIASKVELRASQARLSLFYRNQSGNAVSKFNLTLKDPAELTRFEAAKVPSSDVAAGTNGQVVVMMECMKPASPGPTLTVQYTDSALGDRDATIQLPICLTTFNEGINLNGQDFLAKWGQLAAQAGQEQQEVIKPSNPIKPEVILQALTSVSLLYISLLC